METTKQESAPTTSSNSRTWTTVWDRPNRRVMMIAGNKDGNHHWDFIEHDKSASVPGVYDIWRAGEDIVYVEIRLHKKKDGPLGYPHELLADLLGSMTIWPNKESFIWWYPAADYQLHAAPKKKASGYREN